MTLCRFCQRPVTGCKIVTLNAEVYHLACFEEEAARDRYDEAQHDARRDRRRRFTHPTDEDL